VRRQRGLARHLARCDRDDLPAVLARRGAQELPHRVGIGKRAVARPAVDAVARDQGIQGMACVAGIEAAREAHRAQRPRVELEAGALELVAQEPVVEARVVRDEDPSGEALVQAVGELGEARRARHHLAGDAGERLDRRRDRGTRIHQGRPLRAHLEAVDLDDADLGDAVPRRLAAGGLEVDHRERAFQVVRHRIGADCMDIYADCINIYCMDIYSVADIMRRTGSRF
jgi:hypothetical protein